MASAKGGSGKTVLTATFATFLVHLGKRVLMVDTDAATNGLTLMYFKETRMKAEFSASQRQVPKGIYEGLPNDVRDIVRTPLGVDLIPATFGFLNTEKVPTEQFIDTLHVVLNTYRSEYDFIFLDAQAGSDDIAYVAMSQAFSDQVILVSEYDPLSAAGIERLKGLFREELTYVRTWVLLNKMLPEFVRSFSDFMEVAKYASPIPWDSDVVRAYSRRRLALDFEAGNEFTLAVMQSLRSIFGEEVGADLNAWLKSKVAGLREPIDVQTRDLEEELEGLLRQRSVTSNRARMQKLYSRLFQALSGLGIAFAALYTFFEMRGASGLVKSFSSPFHALELALATSVGVAGFIGSGFLGGKPLPQSVEEVRLDRQFKVLQTRLEKLEALRSADVETLLRNRHLIEGAG